MELRLQDYYFGFKDELLGLAFWHWFVLPPMTTFDEVPY